MEISTVSTNTPVNQNTTTSTDANTASVDYNGFLRLLIAQMKNQDPTKPMDSAQFMAQLASFSNVEQAHQDEQQARLHDDVASAVAGGWHRSAAP